MRTLIFLDLDDTLFQTARKCPPGEQVTAVSFSRTGEPISFITALQRYFLKWLGQDATLIPTTGRSLETFERVRLPFTGQAIVNHGATVLNADGSRDEVWHARVRVQLEDTKADLERLLNASKAYSDAHDLGVDLFWDGEADLPLYLVAKQRGLEPIKLEQLRQFWLLQVAKFEGLYLFANGNNVSVLPKVISKRAAVAYVLERERQKGPLLSIGLGDSVSDLDFMSLCDFVMMPSRGQLFEGQPRDLRHFR